MTEQEVARAVRLYEAGRTLDEIGAELGFSESWVWRCIHTLVDIRPAAPRGAGVSDQQILELRGSGMSWSRIAATTGMSVSGVRYRHDVATGKGWPRTTTTHNVDLEGTET
jgi:DNA-binding Lrp family transcriptional regulator